MLSRLSFKTKLTISHIFIVLVSIGLIAFFLDKNLEDNSLREIRSSIIDQTNIIASQVRPGDLKNDNTASLEALVKILKPRTACRITIIDNRGKVLADSERSEADTERMENHASRPEIRTAMTGKIGVDSRYSVTLRIDMLYAAVPVMENGLPAGIVRLSLPLKSIQRMLSEIRRTILIGLAFALCLALALGVFMATRATRPIHRMIQVSRKFSEGDFSRRIIQAPRDEIGDLARTLNKMAQDIEEKIAEVKTRNQELAAVFNSMIEGVIVVDKGARIVSVNSTIEKMFNATIKNIGGKLFLETIRNKDIADIIEKVIKTGDAISSEIELLLPVRKILQINAAPIFYDRIVNGCIVVIHDITGMRRLETMRRDFVANVSHELKTPLTSIQGFVETLLEGALEDKENNRAFLNIIREHASRLNNLVNDLLSLSRLESKEVSLNKTNIKLREEADKVMHGFKSQAEKKRVETHNEISDILTIRADKDRIDQVLTNLIDNAIKFNKKDGSVNIRGEVLDASIKITVEDNGIGIPEKDIGRIFERFYMVDKARSRDLGGTGLGLSIVKHIIELHGGAVGVESVEGFGSKFWFTIPK